MAMTDPSTVFGQDIGRPASPSRPISERIMVEEQGEHRFRSRADHRKTHRLFGGQVAGQAVLAASLTVPDDRDIHSAQMTFLLPGDSSQPVDYDVTRVRDGGSFASRQVDATQAGRTIFTMLASFQRKEAGLSHQVSAPSTSIETAPAPPEMFADEPGELAWAHTLAGALDVDVRFTLPPARPSAGRSGAGAPEQQFWVRSRQPFPLDERLQAAGLAYFSDMLLLATALGPHGRTIQDPQLQNATINHTVWFHHPLRVDEWFLYDQHSRWSGGARALCHGEIFDQDGRLCATTMQEGLLRVRGDRD